MVTTVGIQTDFTAALKDLVELDFDAIEAYEVAINKIENTTYKTQLAAFKADHERHTRELAAVLKTHGEAAPTGPSAKQWLTKGKVAMGSLIGDNAILAAMKSNEGDTNTAYERVSSHKQIWPSAIEIIERGLADEKRHKAWLESVLSS
jgi:predicted outer membrane protein